MVDVQKLTRPPHLIPEGTTSADLAAAAKETLAAAVVSPEDEKKTRMRARSYTFPFSFTDGTGKVWSGSFTNVVPSTGTRTAIGVMRSQLAGGVDYDSLDPLTRELTMMVAHLESTLDAKRPDWAKDLLAVLDPNVLRALWAEVTAHEATFLGL